MGVRSIATITGAGLMGAGSAFSVTGSELSARETELLLLSVLLLLRFLVLLPLPGLGVEFPEGSESDESCLAVPDFGFGSDPDFGPESDKVARADLIALSHDGCW